MKRAALIAVALFVAGCGHGASGPQQLTDQISRAIYADDLAATTLNFDDNLKKEVTRAEVGDLSDRMHGLGNYKSLTQRSADPDRGRYDFELTFDHGQMIAQLRVDPSGKVGAFRIVPQPNAAVAAQQ